ncbi:MAG: hypothetical protein SGI90_10710 [Candidatus Eisenbacteria bacterium]|nr:hypothetical protein [Candidatus Eisenbacteria bacterium]
MKSINHAIHGLASSLLLNVGLTGAAEKFDTVQNLSVKADASAEDCIWLCNFTPESGE